MEVSAPRSTYSNSHRKYYQEHKQEISQKRKTVDRNYYERHKEDIRRKNLERYYAKKAAATATPEPNVPNVIYLEMAEDSPALPAATPADVSA
jgi:hypothetical protein